MTENDIDDLFKARFMNLSCPPASPEAKGLVEDIIDIIAKSEKRLRARKANEVPVFKSAVGLIIGDLLIGFHTRDAGWPCLSMSTSPFQIGLLGTRLSSLLWKPWRPLVSSKSLWAETRKTSSLIRATKLPTRQASPHDLSPVESL